MLGVLLRCVGDDAPDHPPTHHQRHRQPPTHLVRDPYSAPTHTEHATTRAGDWTDVEDPTYYRTNATADQAELLTIPPGEPLLTREALQQSTGIRRYHRLHMPFSIAEHTPWADDPHLPPAPKVYEHFTAHGHTLTWTEHVRARAPIGDETPTLQVPPGTPLAVDVAENWQSEFLQFFLYIFVTVWVVQRGSPESKKPSDAGVESDERQKVGEYADGDSPPWAAARGWRTALFSRSLGLVMGIFFLLSWMAQSIAGLSAYNADQLADYQDPVAWNGYVTSADFWNRSLQNWQSGFLAVAAMAVLSIYLRQRGSPESKPVGEPHTATGIDG
jgi:membrane protein implicated in regulation of membrane protease activity